jgi:DNA-binding response OmpR family regulator
MAKKILIVDDDLDTLKLVGTTLEREGYTIVAASDGEKALQQVAAERPSLILLDVMMPKMDGYEVTRRLKSDPITASIPIILFTAKAQVGDKVEGLEIGADDYMTKPTHPAELVARVRAMLKRRVTGVTGALPILEEDQPHQSIAILGSKGGQGASSLAVNLGYALRQRTQSDVIVAELRPGRGDMGLLLGIESGEALSQLLRMTPDNIRLQDVDEALKKHKTGLRVLAASAKPSDASLLAAADQMEAITKALARLAPLAVIDLGTGFPAAAQNVVRLCSRVIVITEPYPLNVPRTIALLQDLEEAGTDRGKTLIVSINKVRTDQNLSGSDLEKALSRSIDAVYTPAPELAFHAARRKQPMGEADPESFTAKQSAKLADLILSPITEE